VLRIGDWLGVVCAAEDLPESGDGGADHAFQEIVPDWYGDERLQRAVEPARRAAPAGLSIIVAGETGTGKEGLARAIHAWSNRSGPFVGVNCAAIPEHLFEAELFGYDKNAFTGANQASLGYFRAAHKGTPLLDEVTDLSLNNQAKLLRALEERVVVPLGPRYEPIAFDVCVVAATQEPLHKAAADKRFRADLMARLDGLTVELPPLRSRREDIVPLFLQLLREQGRRSVEVEAKLLEQLLTCDWPLNTRELVQLVKRFVAIHGDEPVLRRAFLPDRFAHHERAQPDSASRRRASTKDDEEFERLLEALREHGGNIGRAARTLGITRARAYRLIEARDDFSLADFRAGLGD
jgi:transcriptional regulator with PAS, ATPase and Fis domain